MKNMHIINSQAKTLKIVLLHQWSRWLAWMSGPRRAQYGVCILCLGVLVAVVDWHLYNHVHGAEKPMRYTQRADLLTLMTYLPAHPVNLRKMLTNTMPNWHHLGPRVHKIVYVTKEMRSMDAEVADAISKYGWHAVRLPAYVNGGFIASIVSNAQSRSQTSFYCFAEWDILFDDGLIHTLERLDKLRFQFSSMVAIGSAHNIKATKDNINDIMFLITSAFFPWKKLPKEQSSRTWPLETVTRQAPRFIPNTAVVDISQTTLSVRQVLNNTLRAAEWKRFGLLPFPPPGSAAHAADRGCVSCADYMTKSAGGHRVLLMQKIVPD